MHVRCEITKEKIEELVGLQVDKITFSSDPGIRAEHDQNRMQGSYEKALAAIDMVKQAGSLSGISTVVIHESLHSEGFLKAYALAEDRDIRFDVQIAEPVGKWDGNKECLITKEDVAYIYELYKRSPIMGNDRTREEERINEE